MRPPRSPRKRLPPEDADGLVVSFIIMKILAKSPIPHGISVNQAVSVKKQLPCAAVAAGRLWKFIDSTKSRGALTSSAEKSPSWLVLSSIVLV